jgi:hypothetical protein
VLRYRLDRARGDSRSRPRGFCSRRSSIAALRSILAVAVVFACAPDTASASQSARLTVSLAPEHLGRSTTVHFGFQISAAPGQVPSPLTELDVRYPPHFGVGTSGLGVEKCSAATLEADGPAGCPADSLMGHGSAFAEVPFGKDIVGETASVAVVRAPAQNGHTALLFYAEGTSPVSAAVVFPGQLWGATRPFGGELRIAVPLVPSLPEGPDVAVVRVTSTIGPSHLTYYEDARGRRVPYRPRGITLPTRCPKGGFRFGASFGFLDGSHVSDATSVPCPHRRAAHKARRPGRPRARPRA